MSTVTSGFVIFTHTNWGYYTLDNEFVDDIRLAKLYPSRAAAYADIIDPNLFSVFINQACLIHEYHKHTD
jgi:hypothetical protein